MSHNNQQDNAGLNDIRLILRDLLKVIKVVAMYPEDNPLPQSMRRTFAERLVDLLAQHGDINLTVTKGELHVGEDTVYTDQSKEDALAGLIFDTGICRLSFKTGLEVPGVYKFLDIVKAYQNSGNKSMDLAGTLWETAIPGIWFKTVEDVALAEYSGDFRVQEVFQVDSEDSPRDLNRGQISTDESQSYEAIFKPDESGQIREDESFISGEILTWSASRDASPSDQVIEMDSQGMRVPDGVTHHHEFIQGTVLDTDSGDTDKELKVLEAVDAMGFGDLTDNAPRVPDTTLILNDEMRLTEEENQRIEELLTRDATFSMFESTAELLKEMLHQESEMDGFYETVTICERVCHEFVKLGKLTYATDVFRYILKLEQQIAKERPLWAERLRDSIVTAGSRDRLQELKRCLNRNQELGAVELRSYLNIFGWQALMGISDLMSQLLHAHHRETIGGFLAERGKDNLAVVAKGVTDKRPDVAMASISVLGRIGDDQALGYLKHCLDHDSKEVRLALATALETCPNDSALGLLQRLVFDRDAEIRGHAIKAIVARRGQAAFDTITDILSEDGFSDLAPDDQRSALIAYSQLGGDMAVEYLLELASRKTLVKDSTSEFLRSAAFDALAHNRGQRSEKALVKLAGSWRPAVKKAARAALQERRELIYGGDDESER